MKIEEQKRKAALAEGKNSGKTPKDIEWDMFLSSKEKMNDDEVAIKHLDKYLEICAAEGNILKICLMKCFWIFLKVEKKLKAFLSPKE